MIRRTLIFLIALTFVMPLPAVVHRHHRHARAHVRSNPVERGTVKTAKATGKGAGYTGQAVADGAAAGGRGVAKGAKWVAKPWRRR